MISNPGFKDLSRLLQTIPNPIGVDYRKFGVKKNDVISIRVKYRPFQILLKLITDNVKKNYVIKW